MSHDLQPTLTSPSRRSLTLDVERYQRMLDAPDMSEEKKAEVIEALWTFVVTFVDLGYEVMPLESCGQDADQSKAEDRIAAPVLISKDTPSKREFASAARSLDKEAS